MWAIWEIRNGALQDDESLLVAEGDELALNITLAGIPDDPLYLGILNWDQWNSGGEKTCPFPQTSLQNFLWRRKGSPLNKGLSMSGVRMWMCRGKCQSRSTRVYLPLPGMARFTHIREAFQTPEVPLGRIDLRGEGAIGGGKVRGEEALQEIT